MKTTRGYLKLSMIVCVILSSVIPLQAAAQNVTVATRLMQSSVALHEEFSVDITVALSGRLSIGGDVYLQYDPAVLQCRHISTSGLFGRADTSSCLPIQSGILRINSMVKTFAEATTSADEAILATITFSAIHVADASRVNLLQTTQLFGSGMGNLVSTLDDSATQTLNVVTPLVITFNFPQADALLNGVYSLEWLLENSISAPIQLTLEVSGNAGETWELIAETLIESSGTFAWDTSGLAGGDEYMLRAGILQNDINQYLQSSAFAVAQPVTAASQPVPEPSTFWLLALGALGLVLRRKQSGFQGRETK